MENTGKTRIISPGRSQGDGMENNPLSEVDLPKNWSTTHTQRSPIDYYHKNFVPTKGKIREPKFVPYEPYKAAVSPIIPTDHLGRERVYEPCTAQSAPSKLVIDSQRVSSLASSIIKLYSDLEDPINDISPETSRKCSADCGEKLRLLEEKVSVLEKEKKELAAQYQVQTEVNADLKKMLVASLGEDVQLKVQFMTEDKALLGKEVLRLSEELEVAQEEVERHSVGCNVWESKFKASSLMLKELVQWKSTLSQKLNQSVESLSALMREHDGLFEKLSAAHSKLECTLSAFHMNAKSITKKNTLPKNLSQLSVEIASLSNKIQEKLHGKLFNDGNRHSESKCPRQFTRTENLVNQFLKSLEQTSIVLPGETKCDPGVVACKILPHACMTDVFNNKFCKHCSGEVKLL